MTTRWKLPAWPLRRVTENLDLAAAIAVCALVVASLWVGVALRPTVSAPPPLPPAPDLTLDFSPQSAPQTLTVATVLTSNGSAQARLEIDADGGFGARQRTVSWSLYVDGFTGYVCTAKANWVTPQDLGDGDYSFMKTAPVPALGGNFLVIDLCWTAQSPLTANSSYLSATLPPVTVPHQAGTLTRTISLGPNGLAAYQLGGATAATSAGPQAWTWQDPLGTSLGDQAVTPLLVSGISIVGIQQASNDTFYSGVAFGVGFGGGIALLLALPDLVRKRMERRKARPGGGAGAGTPSADAAAESRALAESRVSADDSVEAGDSVEADDSIEAT
jgi:hypothetical protein